MKKILLISLFTCSSLFSVEISNETDFFYHQENVMDDYNILRNSNGNKNKTFFNYLQQKNIKPGMVSEEEYNKALKFSKTIPFDSFITDIENQLHKSNMFNIIVNDFILNKYSYGEKLKALLLIRKNSQVYDLSDSDVLSLKKILPDTKTLSNLELITAYFSIFSSIKNIEPFKNFIFDTLRNTEDKLFKSVMLISLMKANNNNSFLTSQDTQELNRIIDFGFKDISNSDYKKYLVSKEEMKNFLMIIKLSFKK